jgi:2'-5' RNA ligase
MKSFSRYAVYFSPPEESDLSKFASSWLGWDSQNGKKISHPIFKDLISDISELTKKQSCYGFHGTLKPPFSLAKTKNERELKAAILELSQSIKKFEISAVSLQLLNGFAAIVATNENNEIKNLAKKCVRELDSFRQPESLKKVQKRRLKGLSKNEEFNLQRWGYPYVMGSFRFHLTLTRRLSPEESKNVMEVLASELTKILSTALPVRDICLFGESHTGGNFQIIQRFPLLD